jgi:rRNA-processing protein FCF1
MPKAASNKTISVVIPQEVYDELKDWAESKDWSMSQAAKNLIIDGLKKEWGKNDAAPEKKK